MKEFFSIIYAYRNREINRIKISMESLTLQKAKNFEVIFVDYGSDSEISDNLKMLLSSYNFVNYHYLPVSHKLWNKSKALNFGINKAKGDFVFIADVDLIFHSDTTMLFQQISHPQQFNLFQLGYLNSRDSAKLKPSISWNDLQPKVFGEVNGMVLVSKSACEKVNGFDEFFHFYGAEDVDFYTRLENSGYKKKNVKNKYFYHNWHPSFSGSEDKIITNIPRIKNIMRINQQHYRNNRENRITTPLRQKGMGQLLAHDEHSSLDNSTRSFKISNILAQVEHFLREELPALKGEIVQVEFSEDPYYNSLKYRLKKQVGRQTQVYCSLKEVNDLVLKEILFNYRDYNYSFKIKNDLKIIEFRIQL